MDASSVDFEKCQKAYMLPVSLKIIEIYDTETWGIIIPAF